MEMEYWSSVLYKHSSSLQKKRGNYVLIAKYVLTTIITLSYVIPQKNLSKYVSLFFLCMRNVRL